MTQFQAPDGTYEIVEKQPVTLVVTNRGDKVLTVTGEADLSLEAPYGRCLEPVRVPFHLKIDQGLDMNRTEEGQVEALGEQFYINDYNLDVSRLVGDELTLNLPMKVLCSEDCQGISNRYGTNPGSGKGDCDDSPLDPRMSVIQDIFKQLKEVQAMSICPKNKSSKARRDSRRANQKMSAPDLVRCSKCGALVIPHRVYRAYGSHNKKEIVSVED